MAGALTGDVSAALTVAAVAKVGFFAGTAGGLTTGFISSAGGQFEANVQQHGWNTSQWNSMDWGKVWRDTAFAGISGGVTGAIGGVIGARLTASIGSRLGLTAETLGSCTTSWSQSIRQHATHAISGALGSGLTDATIQVVNISLGVQQGFNWRQLGSSVAIGAATSVASYRLSRACFAAGTKIMIPIWDRERHGVTPAALAMPSCNARGRTSSATPSLSRILENSGIGPPTGPIPYCFNLGKTTTRIRSGTATCMATGSQRTRFPQSSLQPRPGNTLT